MKNTDFGLLPVIVLVFAVLFVYIYLHIASERLGYKNGEIKIQVEKEKNTNAQLHIELNRLSSPERLDKIAKETQFSSPVKKQVIELPVIDH